jgi:hypothetical protein
MPKSAKVAIRNLIVSGHMTLTLVLLKVGILNEFLYASLELP